MSTGLGFHVGPVCKSPQEEGIQFSTRVSYETSEFKFCKKRLFERAFQNCVNETTHGISHSSYWPYFIATALCKFNRNVAYLRLFLTEVFSSYVAWELEKLFHRWRLLSLAKLQGCQCSDEESLVEELKDLSCKVDAGTILQHNKAPVSHEEAEKAIVQPDLFKIVIVQGTSGLGLCGYS